MHKTKISRVRNGQSVKTTVFEEDSAYFAEKITDE